MIKVMKSDPLKNRGARQITRTGEGAAAPTRRDLNKRDKQNRILGAARALFQSQGYSATTTQQIARAAGIAIGTLFLYARNKEDLLLQVFLDDIFDVIDKADQAAASARGIHRQLDRFFAVFFDYHAEDEDLSHQLIRELTFIRNPEQLDSIRQMITTLIARIEQRIVLAAQAGPAPSDFDPHQAARALFGLYYHHLQNWLGGFYDRATSQSELAAISRYLLRDLP